MAEGIVYILINDAMPGYAKIGRTTNLHERIRSLSNSSLPVTFECFYAARVADMESVERSLHEGFGDTRVHPRREFFTADPHRVRTVLQMVALEEVTATGITEQDEVEAIEIVEEVRERRDRFNFEEVRIPVGTVLTFSGRPDVTCTVVNERPAQVEFNGQVTSTSKSAQEVLGKNYRVNGNLYWCHGDKTLWDIRDQLGEVSPR